MSVAVAQCFRGAVIVDGRKNTAATHVHDTHRGKSADIGTEVTTLANLHQINIIVYLPLSVRKVMLLTLRSLGNVVKFGGHGECSLLSRQM